MLKTITKKFVGDILPSVVATVIGAYVVTHYINAKPDTPPSPPAEARKSDDASQSSNAAQPAAAASANAEATKSDIAKAKAGGDQADKASPDKTAADKAAAEPSADKHATPKQQASREKAPAEERRETNRDPNDVLRAAVERVRAAEPSRAQSAPQVAAPLPPATTVTPQAATTAVNLNGPAVTGSLPSNSSTRSTRYGERVPSPPGEIPTAPVDLSADADSPQTARPNVAEDVLSGVRSMFHAVLPR